MKRKKSDLRGFPIKCRTGKGKWTKSKWERCLKKVEKKGGSVNKYAVCNASCLKETSRLRRRNRRFRK